MPWTSDVPAAFLLFLLFQGVPGTTHVTQKPPIVMVHEGKSANITCFIPEGKKLAGMYLKREVVNTMNVLYITANSTNYPKDARYKDRVEVVVHSTEVRITLHSLQKNDTDLYVCRGSVLVNNDPQKVWGQGTILVVKELKQAECHLASWVPYVLSVLALVLVSVLGCFILSHMDIKRHCQERKIKQANTVYEDMSWAHPHALNTYEQELAS
ncbi:uncharacterized protein LOC142023741 [Carettochelys insculpta]|uniref:uncharacterized protein LOC142023741 n=1 Tax=Carettochelys insculpta TaxID=44489 RepID=UPI003EC06DC5